MLSKPFISLEKVIFYDSYDASAQVLIKYGRPFS